MLKNFLKTVLVVSVLFATPRQTTAFSLLGPFDASYQLTTLGYNLPITVNSREGDLGGPMNLNEEYRWSTPFIVYGFDQSFIEYFGPRGVAAVEAAIQILNELPPVSELSRELKEYPLESSRYNYTAQQLGIVDIKSVVLSCMIEQLGLACPERYVKTIFQQRPIATGFDYSVITRNFDPVPVVSGDSRSYSYSPYVNGTLYTYAIRHILPPPFEFWDAQDIAVDVSTPRISVAATAGLQAGVVDPRVSGLVQGGFGGDGAGLFYTGLSRDDVGGLRYLYDPSRTNVETLPTGATAAARSGGGGGGGGGIGGSPWTITYPFISTNAVAATNDPGTGIVGTVVNAAWRGGVDKLAFVRIDPDPFIAQFPRPLLLRYTEVVFDPTRRRFVTQAIQKVFTRPDITFTATDLGAPGNSPRPYVFSHIIGQFNNNSAINSGVGQGAAGPGTIEAGAAGSFISLNKVGPWTFNVSETTEDQSLNGFIFGSFDGTTNAPIVYPTGVSITDLERAIYGRN